MSFLLAIVFSYLIGSVSLGFFFGKIFKGINVRDYGNKNTGATNTYNILGKAYGIISGAFDFFKTPLAYYISISFFKISPDLAILISLFAVLGHIFPFYLKFKGGRGVASLFGLCAITLFYTQSVFALALISGTIFYTLKISKNTTLDYPFRKLLKLGALVMPLGLIFLPRSPVIFSIFVVLIFSLGFDVLRFLISDLNKKYLSIHFFAKQKEKKYLSGISLLFLSTFLVFFFFEKEIAVISITFFILGDIFAPIGKKFLAIPFIKDKTLGGFLIIFSVTFISGIFLNSLTPLDLSLQTLIIASLLTGIFDQLSFLLDDNALVPFGTSLSLYVLGRISNVI